MNKLILKNKSNLVSFLLKDNEQLVFRMKELNKARELFEEQENVKMSNHTLMWCIGSEIYDENDSTSTLEETVIENEECLQVNFLDDIEPMSLICPNCCNFVCRVCFKANSQQASERNAICCNDRLMLVRECLDEFQMLKIKQNLYASQGFPVLIPVKEMASKYYEDIKFNYLNERDNNYF